MNSKSYITYALIMCLLVMLCLTWMEVSGNNQTFESNSPFKIVMILAPVVIWYLGIRAKKKALGGFMTWKQGVKEAWKMSLVFGIISPFIFMVYYLWVNPAIVAHVKEIYRLTNYADTQVIAIDMIAQFIMSLVMGLVIGMILSAFMRSRNSTTA